MSDGGLLMPVGEVVVPDDVMFDSFKELCTNCSTDSGWHQEYNKSGTKIWSKKNDWSSLKILKGRTTFEDVPPLQLYDVIHDPTYRKHWDLNMIEGREICYINPNNDIGYYSLKSPLPGIKNRDFVTQRSWLAREDINEYIIMNHSVYHKSCPPKPDFVRGKSFLTGYYITEHRNKKGRQGCEFYYVTQCDIGGKIPTWAVNFGTKWLAPRMLKKLHNVAREYPDWKAKNDPNCKPWSDPSQNQIPRLNYADVQVPENHQELLCESLDESDLPEPDLSSTEIMQQME